MAGNGPPPKHHTARARTNKASTRATLHEQDADEVEVPELPQGISWHPMAEDWWEDIWSSPMSNEWHDSDIHGLYRLAALVNDYWLADSVTQRLKIAPEIRQSAQPFGLSPLDRRRLEWNIETVKEAQAKGRKREQKNDVAPAPEPGEDPRLYVV